MGDGARIGANSVVLKEVPAGATVVGIPGRIVKGEGAEKSARFAAYAVVQEQDDPYAKAIQQLVEVERGELPRDPHGVADLLARGYRGGLSIEPHITSVVHLSQEAADPEIAFRTYIEYGKRLVLEIRDSEAGPTEGDVLVRKALERLTDAGWGELRVVGIDAASRAVRVESPNLIGVEAIAYSERKGPRPSDDFTRGLIAGAASEAFGEAVDAIEVRCRANGADTCAFVSGRPGREADARRV